MSFPVFSDEYFMNEALKEALKALDRDEVPVGCVIVSQNRIIGKGSNAVEQLKDVTAHAEMIALTAASQFFNHKFLDDCSIYITLEPCAMCAAAIGWARVSRLIYGAEDPKKGFRLFSKEVLHPKTTITGGILANDCGSLIKEFFLSKRN